jgi:hypothetical protein
MRRELAGYLGYGEIVGKDGEAWTTTTTIAASTALISTELRDYGFDDFSLPSSGDDALNNLWVIIHGTNNAQEIRRVSAYDASAGQLTLTGTDLSAESGAVDFELHRYSPTYLRYVFNRVLRIAYPQVHLPITKSVFTARGATRYDIPSAIIGRPTEIRLQKGLESSFENNILSNADFEDWTSGSPDSWSATTLDVAEEESSTSPTNYMVLETGSSVRATSQSGNTGTLLQSISSPSTHSGQRISLSVWVYSLTAAKVRTQITINSTANTGTTADGGEHGGTGWELLTHYEDSTTTLSTLAVGVRVDSDATDNTEFYIDRAICSVGPLQVAEQTGELMMNWEYAPEIQGSTLRQHVIFPAEFDDNYLLQFHGKGFLSSLSAETDTIEIGAPETDLLYAYAAVEIYRRYASSAPDLDKEFNRERLIIAQTDIERLSNHVMSRGPRRRLKIPDAV